jgi:hypothetical protein
MHPSQKVAELRAGILAAPSGVVGNERKDLLVVFAYIDELEKEIAALRAKSTPVPAAE